MRFSSRSKDAISYYDKEVDDALGSDTDSEEERKRKKKSVAAFEDEEEESSVIDAVCTHRGFYF